MLGIAELHVAQNNVRMPAAVQAKVSWITVASTGSIVVNCCSPSLLNPHKARAEASQQIF